MLIPDGRVAEVVRLLTDLPASLDPLDAVESVMELEEEFGIETVRLAARFVEASRRHRSVGMPSSSSVEDVPLRDRGLDP